jgi:hypothetical protein
MSLSLLGNDVLPMGPEKSFLQLQPEVSSSHPQILLPKPAICVRNWQMLGRLRCLLAFEQILQQGV